MSRLLWLSNGPWCPSGYGEQTALFVPRLAALGNELAVLCNYGLQGRETLWGDVVCYPSDNAWGNHNLATFADRHRADQVIALCDAWVLRPSDWPEGVTAAVWAPIDRYPIPPLVLASLQHERIQPIAMSRYGDGLMQQFELDPIYVPHGVDTHVFRPQPEIRDEVRDELGIPRDVFLVGMVAANTSSPVSRKAFPQAFLGFSRFSRRHEDAWLYVHSQAKPFGSGIALDTLAEATRCPPRRVRFPEEVAWQIGMPTRTVAAIYSALDVLLAPSMGEGFGIPILEAQACGVPVIASDHSAMTELASATGWLVGGDPWWDPIAEAFLINPSIDQIDAALEAAYDARDDVELRERAVEFAADYDADVVTERYWRPALERLAGRELVEEVA